jgi:Mg-chelatase subunit ChlD
MKTQLAGIALFAATVSAVAFYPALNSTAGTPPTGGAAQFVPPVDPDTQERPRIEVIFALDTTSSMSGFIQAAKEKIWSIASTMASAQPAPEIKIGLIAFRDRGDAYVTQVTDLSADLDSVYATLMNFKAAGGGDGPESVNQALYDAVHRVSWSQGTGAYKVIFLVGDAPPHRDYPFDVQYPETLKAANAKGIRVNTIQSGTNGNTTREWQRIAALSQGEFFNVSADGSAVAIATPFDRHIAALSRELDDTRLYFGSAEDKAQQKLKLDATEKLHANASAATRARRAAFNASPSGAHNFLGKKELVDAVVAGRVDLDAMAEAELPASLQAVAPAARKSMVMDRANKRGELQQQIEELTGKRDAYLADKVAAEGSAEASLDNKLYHTVRRQAATKGMVYEEAPKY